MKTIEERAKVATAKYECQDGEYCQYYFTDGYVKGATELIDKACEWIENYDNEQLPYTDLDCDGHCYVDMRKFAEEFRKAMKGE